MSNSNRKIQRRSVSTKYVSSSFILIMHRKRYIAIRIFLNTLKRRWHEERMSMKTRIYILHIFLSKDKRTNLFKFAARLVSVLSENNVEIAQVGIASFEYIYNYW